MAWHSIRNRVVMPTRPGCLYSPIEFLSAGASDRVDGCSRHRFHLSVFNLVLLRRLNLLSKVTRLSRKSAAPTHEEENTNCGHALWLLQEMQSRASKPQSPSPLVCFKARTCWNLIESGVILHMHVQLDANLHRPCRIHSRSVY